MCYPKPGPRCSASAAARLARAKHAAYTYFMNSRDQDREDWAELDELSKARDEAQREYDITPAGIKALERSAATLPISEYAQQKLADAKAERAARLQAIKALDQGDDPVQEEHQEAPVGGKIHYEHSTLSSEGAVLQASAPGSPDVTTLLNESEAWVTKLTSDEIEAMHWYSMGGYEAINGGLSDPKRQAEVSNASSKKAAPASTIALLDSALSKANSDKQAVVYRRHFFYNDGDSVSPYANLSFDEMSARFPKGSIYKPNFYMSTSLNPANIGMPMSEGEKSFMVRLEILTRRGAAMPAVSNGATSEQEILLPRDGEYRVVSNDHRVSVSSRGKVEQVRVIQLQEL